MDSDDDIPKWAYYICPSCAIYYGTKALIRIVKKRRTKHHLSQIIEK